MVTYEPQAHPPCIASNEFRLMARYGEGSRGAAKKTEQRNGKWTEAYKEEAQYEEQ